MAALKTFVDELEKELTCSICCEVFTNPKALPCMHSYCEKCIAEWFERSGNQSKRLSCPLCKTIIELPDGDVSKLNTSFYFTTLLQLLRAMKKSNEDQASEVFMCECCEKPLALTAFCPQCDGLICGDCVNLHKTIKRFRLEHEPTMLKDFKQENIASYVKNQMLCKEKFHEKNKLEYFCQEETCMRFICQKCAILYHQNHRMQSLEEASEKVKQAIRQDMDRVNQLKEKYEKELEQSKQNMTRIEREIDFAKTEVDKTVERIWKMAKEQGRAIRAELDDILRAQKTANNEEQSDINTAITRASEFGLHCQTLLDRPVANEVMESKKALQESCQTLIKAPPILQTKPMQRNMTVRYVKNKELFQSLQDIGNIEKSVTDPSKCTIKSPINNVLFDGVFKEFHIVTRNAEEKVCHTEVEHLDVKIKDLAGNEVENKIFYEQCGKFLVRYKAENYGQHEIQVKIGNESIKNSPQYLNILETMTKIKHVKTFGKKGQDKGQLNKPQSIAVSNTREVAIADWNNHRIQIFSLDGSFLREFGSKGEEEGELSWPFGVVFKKDRIVVSNGPKGKGRIQEFHLNGSYVRTVFKSKHWFTPRGMCFNGDKGTIAVSCWGSKERFITPSIKIFSEEGNLLHEFHMEDFDEQPWYITYCNGKYFLSYYKRSYIGVFDEQGMFLYKFGKYGPVNGLCNVVGGLSASGQNMVLVCDINNHRVQFFTHEGHFLTSFGGYGNMDNPIDLAVTDDGQILVLQFSGNDVRLWR